MDETYLTDMNLLYEGFRSSMKGSAWKEEPQRFELDVLSELVKLRKEIETRTYRTMEGSEFTLNERGKIRHIHGGRIRDRVIRHVLCDNELQEALHPYLIYNNGASQKGKGLSFARKMFERDLHNYWLKYRTNEGYVGFVDLSKFYDNIQHDKIREMVFPKINEGSRWLMDEVIRSFELDVSYMSDDEYSRSMTEKFDSVKYYTTVPGEAKTGEKFLKKSVNIGDQVSQNIGIFYPTRIDNYVKIVRGVKWYGRYMDDMYIICRDRDELKSIIEGIVNAAAEIGLFVNQKKTRIVKLSSTYKYLQIKYSLTNTGKVIKRINPKNVTRQRRRMKAYKRQLDKGKMSYEDIFQSCRSWMGNYTPIMSRRQIKHIKSLYRNLFDKELVWKQRSLLQTAVN
ncbi:MAG: RNA-directed DNA polymerase [Flexilinea sp.]|nr:RNA-directed DNA polymerase [Flexilinea sp.]